MTDIERLQEQVAFQEHSIEQLNEALSSQQQQITQLSKELRLAMQLIQQWRENSNNETSKHDNTIIHEIPPHY